MISLVIHFLSSCLRLGGWGEGVGSFLLGVPSFFLEVSFALFRGTAHTFLYFFCSLGRLLGHCMAHRGSGMAYIRSGLCSGVFSICSRILLAGLVVSRCFVRRMFGWISSLAFHSFGGGLVCLFGFLFWG